MEGGWDGEREKKGHVKKHIDKCEMNTRRQQGGKRGLMQGRWHGGRTEAEEGSLLSNISNTNSQR